MQRRKGGARLVALVVGLLLVVAALALIGWSAAQGATPAGG